MTEWLSLCVSPEIGWRPNQNGWIGGFMDGIPPALKKRKKNNKKDQQSEAVNVCRCGLSVVAIHSYFVCAVPDFAFCDVIPQSWA